MRHLLFTLTFFSLLVLSISGSNLKLDEDSDEEIDDFNDGSPYYYLPKLGWNLMEDLKNYHSDSKVRKYDGQLFAARAAEDDEDKDHHSAIELGTVLEALKKILVFFQRNYRHLNLDAVIGPRIVEGQFKVLARRLAIAASESSSTVLLPSLDDIKELHNIAVLAKKVSDAAIPAVQLTSPDYYKRLGRLLESGFWELDYPTRKTGGNFFPVVFAYEIFNETTSDDCLTELLGTGKHEGYPCLLSDECWEIMTQSQASRFSLTHQILYLQIGEMMGCGNVLKVRARKQNHVTLRMMQDTYCANVLREMKENSAGGHVVERKQDLFMEQAAVCGMFGYNDLFSMDWLSAILSWQKPEGCYGTPEDVSTENQERHKVKREEKELKDGCLAHKSTVAAAALAVYVRFLIENPTLTPFQ